MSTLHGKKLSAAAVMAAFSMAVCLPSQAQTIAPAYDTPEAELPADQTSGYAQTAPRTDAWNVRASSLLRQDVANARGETVGTVWDLMVNIANQNVRYVVLQLGGSPGVSEKLVPIPMEAFDVDSDRRRMVLNVSRDRLVNAPGFMLGNWPDWDLRTQQQLDAYYGVAAGDRLTAAQAPAHMMRITDLIDRDVSDRAGAEVGEIQDLVIDVGQGEVAYAVLEFDTAWNVEDRLLPVPMTAIAFPGDLARDLVVDTDMAQAQITRGFAQDRWPDLNEDSFRESMNEWFQEPELPPVPGQAGLLTPSADLIEE